MRSYVRLAAVAAALAFISCGEAAAQSWPDKPIHMIVPFPPGGSADTLARLLDDKIQATLRQPIVVDNHPGAGGNLGTDIAAKSPPDGYTFLMTPSSIASQPSLYSKLTWDPVRDFAPVGLVATTPNILVVNTAVPAHSVKELIALAKAQPGRLSYASGGIGATNHLAGELFKRMTDTQIVHVPYRGNPLAVIDVMNGQVTMMFDFMITSLPHVKAGELRALAVTGAKRAPQVPDLPTVSESGVPGYEASTWFAVMAPAGTPGPIIARLNHELNAALTLPDIRKRLDQLGAEPLGGTPDDAARLLKSEIAKWADVIKAAHIQIE
jgi:tripartite-type tricarboxylate transporter receptor subunit TctC